MGYLISKVTEGDWNEEEDVNNRRKMLSDAQSWEGDKKEGR
jgi:hypothetical protein